MRRQQLYNRKTGFLARGIAVTAFGFFLVTATLSAEDLDGKTIFEKRCTGCHAPDSDHEGPRLRGVVGRRAGSVQTFDYSKALQGANFTWNPALLEKWLTDSNSLVPGNDMSFRVSKPEERAAIIAYLKTLRP